MGIKDIELKLISEANKEASAIKEKASEAASFSLKEEERMVLAQELRAEQAAEKEGETIKIEMVSPVKISAKNELLSKKQDIVSKVYKEALDEISKMGERSYKQAIMHLLKSLPKDASGDIIPREGKEDITKKAVSEFLKRSKKSPALSVKKGTRSISAGFIFRSEKFNMDFSFDTIMRDVRERTEPKVTEMIFKEEEK